MPETCICCGAVIPEGRQVCPACEKKNFGAADVILPNGQPVYLKTVNKPCTGSLQLFLYDLLSRGKL